MPWFVILPFFIVNNNSLTIIIRLSWLLLLCFCFVFVLLFVYNNNSINLPKSDKVFDCLRFMGMTSHRRNIRTLVSMDCISFWVSGKGTAGGSGCITHH